MEKVSVFERLFALMERDWKVFILTLSIFSNVYLGNKLIKTNEEMSKQIIEEVRKQAPQVIQEETSKQLSPVKSKIDTTLDKINNQIND